MFQQLTDIQKLMFCFCMKQASMFLKAIIYQNLSTAMKNTLNGNATRLMEKKALYLILCKPNKFFIVQKPLMIGAECYCRTLNYPKKKKGSCRTNR